MVENHEDSSMKSLNIILLHYKKGSAIWLPCPELVWTRAVIYNDFDHTDSCFQVQLEDGSIKSIPHNDSLPFLCNPDFLTDTNDLTTLSHLHEPDVLYSLKYRFDLGHIYTYCGIVLVAINPYRDCDLYGKTIFGVYRNNNVRQLDPHVYAIAEESFTSLTQYDRNQSIIISGESGAGKTVSAKHVMQYLAEACNPLSGSPDNEAIENRVLASNPFTEAFANAKTVRNDNSSRFGKFIKLLFCKRHQMCGAFMQTYLLEKSRLVNQNTGERNYHIFYQMCAARLKDDVLADMFLDHCSRFYYLSGGQCSAVEGMDDELKFAETKNSMLLIGIDENTMRQVFRILSGLLQIGNIAFSASSPSFYNDTKFSSFDNGSQESLTKACYLLGIEENAFEQVLMQQTLKAGREILTRRLTNTQAISARDATAKLIYERLFNWIVRKINACLSFSNSAQKSIAGFPNPKEQIHVHKFVGVLDIYGFEIFETNSFEQLCINYANEMLQQQFNEHVFKLEQAEYVREGIKWSFINFSDNQPCLDLIEARLGILDMLVQECRLAKASDANFLINLTNQSQTSCASSYFSIPLFSKPPGQFIIRHFAGDVKYSVAGFVEKNLDAVHNEQVDLVKNSKLPLLSEILFDAAESENSKHGVNQMLHAVRRKCLASQFKQSLHDLCLALNATMPHYIRCIKPNDYKIPFDLSTVRTVEQLRACGVLETIRISASGYPSRWTYPEFYLRYKMLLSKKQSDRFEGNSRDFAQAVCSVHLQEGQFELGHTKIFFRTGQVALLENVRAQTMKRSAIVIQAHVRGFLARRRFRRLLKALRTVQVVGKAWLAYRYLKYLQMHRAVIVIQSNIRAFVCHKRYKTMLLTVVKLQTTYRARLLRRKLFEDVVSKRIIALQGCIRGMLLRRRSIIFHESVIIIQKWVRRWLCKRLYKKLKVEAKSMSHLQDLNTGLENKIISLQQRLDQAVSEKNSTRNMHEDNLTMRSHIKNQVNNNRISEKQLLVERSKVSALNEKIAQMTSQFESFQSEAASCRNILESEVKLLTDENQNLKAQIALIATQKEDRCISKQTHGGCILIRSVTDFLIAAMDYKMALTDFRPASLPAYIIFMCVRWHDKKQCPNLSLQALSDFCKVLQNETNNQLEMLLLWMSNAWRLLQLCRQYSSEVEYRTYNTDEQAKFELVNCDSTSDYRLSICDLISTLYRRIIDGIFIKTFTQSKIVAFMLDRSSASHGKSHDAHFTSLESDLNSIYLTFQSCDIEWALSSQIFNHLLQYIEAHALNVLMLRRDFCTFTKSVDIKHNVVTLVNWIKDRNLTVEGAPALSKLYEAANLLQIRKTEENINCIDNICSSLSATQIIRLLTSYSPTESYEPRITSEFMKELEMQLKKKRGADFKKYNESLYLPTCIKPVLQFPYVQSNLILSDISVPDILLPYLSYE